MNTRRQLAGALGMIGLLALAPVTVHAQLGQPRPYVAPYGAYNIDGEEGLLGAAVGVPLRLGSSTLWLNPGFEIYPFIDNGSFYTFSFDVHYPIQLRAPNVHPYFGGGLVLNRASFDTPITGSVSNTNAQLNAIGGIGFGIGAFQPFLEGNLRFVDGSAFLLKGGGRITIGR